MKFSPGAYAAILAVPNCRIEFDYKSRLHALDAEGRVTWQRANRNRGRYDPCIIWTEVRTASLAGAQAASGLLFDDKTVAAMESLMTGQIVDVEAGNHVHRVLTSLTLAPGGGVHVVSRSITIAGAWSPYLPTTVGAPLSILEAKALAKKLLPAARKITLEARQSARRAKIAKRYEKRLAAEVVKMNAEPRATTAQAIAGMRARINGAIHEPRAEEGGARARALFNSGSRHGGVKPDEHALKNGWGGVQAIAHICGRRFEIARGVPVLLADVAAWEYGDNGEFALLDKYGAQVLIIRKTAA